MESWLPSIRKGNLRTASRTSPDGPCNTKALQTVQCPFKNLPEKRASRWDDSLTAEKMEQCRWVKPKLLCQVPFVEWTDAGHLRHCTFVWMRDDKKPTEVVRET
jgi:ATP-dependent DNA ligase